MRRLAISLTLAATVIVSLALPASAAPAGIVTASHENGAAGGGCRLVDPIVSFGTASAHEHSFYGVRGITPTTRTSNDLRVLSSTWVRASNHSAFWVPCVYEDGRLMTPTTQQHILAYYQFKSTTRLAPPEDTAGVSSEMGYRCNTGGGTVTNLPPATCSGTTFVLSGFMRGTRDLGFSGSTVFDIRVFIRLSRGTRTGTLGQITIGGPPGSSTIIPNDDIHFDYIWAHDRAKFQAFIDQCAPPKPACGTNPAVLA